MLEKLKKNIDSLPENPTIKDIKNLNKSLPSGVRLEKRGKEFYHSRNTDNDICKQVNIACHGPKNSHVEWMPLSGDGWKDKLFAKLSKAIHKRQQYVIDLQAKEQREKVLYNIENERKEIFDRLVREKGLKLTKLSMAPFYVNRDMVVKEYLIKELSVAKVIELYEIVDKFLEQYTNDN